MSLVWATALNQEPVMVVSRNHDTAKTLSMSGPGKAQFSDRRRLAIDLIERKSLRNALGRTFRWTMLLGIVVSVIIAALMYVSKDLPPAEALSVILVLTGLSLGVALVFMVLRGLLWLAFPPGNQNKIEKFASEMIFGRT